MTTNIYPTSAAASPTAAQDPLWEWNGTDTTQFEGSDAFQSASCSLALSVVANANVIGGNVLRVAGTVNAGGIAVRLITQTFPFTSNRRSLRFEVDLFNIDVQAAGFAILADDSGANLYSYQRYFLGLGLRDRVDNGVLVTDATALTGLPASLHGHTSYHTDADKVAATRPRFRASGVCRPYLDPDSKNMEDRHFDWAGEPAAAGWTSLTCDRLGIAVRGDAALGNLTCDIEAIRIYSEAT